MANKKYPEGHPFHLGALYTSQHTDYSPDDMEFIKAMEEYRRRYNCAFPTCREVLYVLKSLGYRKQEG